MGNAPRNDPASGLVLDFGGVITRTLFETHEQTEAALGLGKGSLTWRGPFAPETDPLWQSMQAGEISERDYWRVRTEEVALLTRDEEVALVIDAWLVVGRARHWRRPVQNKARDALRAIHVDLCA